MAAQAFCAYSVLRCLLRAHPDLEDEVRAAARASADDAVDALVAGTRPRRAGVRHPANGEAPRDEVASARAAHALRRMGVGP